MYALSYMQANESRPIVSELSSVLPLVKRLNEIATSMPTLRSWLKKKQGNAWTRPIGAKVLSVISA